MAAKDQLFQWKRENVSLDDIRNVRSHHMRDESFSLKAFLQNIRFSNQLCWPVHVEYRPWQCWILSSIYIFQCLCQFGLRSGICVDLLRMQIERVSLDASNEFIRIFKWMDWILALLMKFDQFNTYTLPIKKTTLS